MSSIHIFLANKFIEEQHEEFELSKDEMTHGVVYALMFQNIRIRKGKPAGLKLTREGFKWLKKYYDFFELFDFFFFLAHLKNLNLSFLYYYSCEKYFELNF